MRPGEVNLRRHGIASAVAMLYFLIMSVMAGSGWRPVLYALGMIVVVCTALYFHYHRQARITEAVSSSVVTPGQDDRVIPRDVRVAVIVRDGGKCQLQLPGICLVDKQIDIDHKVPYEWGGSSKDENNLWCACAPCNKKKSNHWADTPGGRLTREEYMRMTGRRVLV